MKKAIFPLLPFIIIFLIFGCGSKSDWTERIRISDKSSKELIVYGSNNCEHCVAFDQKLDSAGVVYTFRDIDENNIYFLEVQRKIKSINYQGFVKFPVLDIEGEIHVNPPFSQIKNLLR